LQTGKAGICAVKPIIVDGTCIVDGEKSTIKNHSKVVLCEDDMTIVAEYEVQINA
jgi:hypothetical protein